MKVWLDIENPPQVQYLLPFRRAFEAAGADVIITSRDYGCTVEMLRRAGAEPHVFGASAGRGKLRKARVNIVRARRLARFFRDAGPPDAVVAASRAAALAARRLGVPSFDINDYEYADVSVARFTRSTVLFPEVIDPQIFLRQGLRAEQLVPFKGLKEDLTFNGADIDTVEPYDLGPLPAQVVRVLVRPPSETSHYYQAASTALSRAALEHLGEKAVVIFAPRESAQVRLLEGIRFVHQPIVLTQPVPFIPLLKSVDGVVCSGGTMLREAAYLGIPAYSIFQSQIGAVDRWLAQTGRASLLSSTADLARISLAHRTRLRPLDTNAELLDQIVALVTAEIGGTGSTPVLQRLSDRRPQERSECAPTTVPPEQVPVSQ